MALQGNRSVITVREECFWRSSILRNHGFVIQVLLLFVSLTYSNSRVSLPWTGLVDLGWRIVLTLLQVVRVFTVYTYEDTPDTVV